MNNLTYQRGRHEPSSPVKLKNSMVLSNALQLLVLTKLGTLEQTRDIEPGISSTNCSESEELEKRVRIPVPGNILANAHRFDKN